MIKKFYEETGMYVDWKQLIKLPRIDTLIDIGVGPNGTEDLYNHFTNAKLILIDPIDEAKEYAKKISKTRDVKFFQNALGKKDDDVKEIKITKQLVYTSFLEISDINREDDVVKKKNLKIFKLDTLINEKKKLGRIGIKVDTEGFELDVMLGATEILKYTKFVIAEVRHNHESLRGVYKLHEFMKVMSDNKFVLTTILTAKPFIADLCFQPQKELLK